MLSRVPFAVDDEMQAYSLADQMKEKGVLVDTRGDYIDVLLHEDQCYVVVYTGNISGLVFDLEVEGFL